MELGSRLHWLVLLVGVAILSSACGAEAEPVLAGQAPPTTDRGPLSATVRDLADGSDSSLERDSEDDVAAVTSNQTPFFEGAGADVALECPEGVEQHETSWPGLGQESTDRAVREGFGDFVLDVETVRVELEATDDWATWGARDSQGRLVGLVTIVRSGEGWDLSHGSYCHIVEPVPPPAPFTIYVSNQSFEEPAVHVTVTVDGLIIVDQIFDVEGQHNWIAFELDLDPGVHTLRAVSDTGVETTATFRTEPDQPLWAVLDYWYYLDEDGRYFSFNTSHEPIYFA